MHVACVWSDWMNADGSTVAYAVAWDHVGWICSCSPDPIPPTFVCLN